MSRCESPESRTRDGVSPPGTRIRRASTAVAVGAAVAAVTSCVAIVLPSCGGTHPPSATTSVDAGVDALAPVDFCAEQLSHTYVSLVSFENDRRDLAASPNPMNPAVNPSYVSFDLTGT